MPSALVIGAGVFGASLADRLALDGWEVTLVERDEPGHARAESGGETRLMRCSHGADEFYARSAWRALELWRELGDDLLVESGVPGSPGAMTGGSPTARRCSATWACPSSA